MKSFSKRNPIPIGLASLAIIAVLLVLAYRADSLPVIGSGPEYKAQFSEAAGLGAGDEVRIAGVKVGKVTKIALDGGHVLVTFRAKDADLGDATTASIQVKTLLGDKFLSLDPAGSRELTSDDQIPLERTVAPYDVVVAFNQLSENVGALDTTQLAASLRTLSETFKDTPKDVKTSLEGLSRLSVTIASRNDQLAHLLDNTDKASGLLAARNQDISAILGDGSKLLEELNNRKDAIRSLLDGTRELSKELRGLVDDNEDQIGHTLDELDRLTDTLQKHEDDIVKGVRRLGPFATVFTNALGSGRWFDNTAFGLLPNGILPPPPMGISSKGAGPAPGLGAAVPGAPQLPPVPSLLQPGGNR